MLANLGVIVDDLDLGGTTIRPDETEAILRIDPNAMLSDAIAFQRLQLIGRWHPQVIQRRSTIHPLKLAPRHLPQERWARPASALRVNAVEDVFRASTPEGMDHLSTIARYSCYRNRPASELILDDRFKRPPHLVD